MMILKSLFYLFVPFTLILTAFAKDAPPRANRQKTIDFEGELVEGVNKRPSDSLNQISEYRNRRKKHHLYKKRQGFRTETATTLHEMRTTQ